MTEYKVLLSKAVVTAFRYFKLHYFCKEMFPLLYPRNPAFKQGKDFYIKIQELKKPEHNHPCKRMITCLKFSLYRTRYVNKF